MPELPEVETTRLGIKPYIENQSISRVIIRDSRLRWPVANELRHILVGQTIDVVSRRAKYILLETDIGILIIHLGMSGSLRVLYQNDPIKKHDHIDLEFRNGVILRFNDPRRFGSILWTDKPIQHHFLFHQLGPEPLDAEFNGDYLYAMAKNKRTPVKSFIMDSHIVVGVGNIYANEALFLAGIRPIRSAGNISSLRYELLATCIKEVLFNAIKQGGTTLRDFVNEQGKPGYFQQQLRVYGRSGLPCKNCLATLSEIRIANRTTVYCRYCQR